MTRNSIRVFLLCSSMASFLGATPAFATDGEALYMDKCALCHGEDGHAETPVGKAMNAHTLVDPKLKTIDDKAFIALFRGNPKHEALAASLTDEDLLAVLPAVKKRAAGAE